MRSLSQEQELETLFQRLARVTPDSARRWGRMTAPQMVCHLSDAFSYGLGEKPASDVSTFLSRTVIKWIALKAPMTWPHGVKTRPEMDQLIGGTKPADFANDVEQLRDRMTRFVSANASLDARFHPIFGHMSREEWLRWGYLHTDHHLRQFGL